VTGIFRCVDHSASKGTCVRTRPVRHV